MASLVAGVCLLTATARPVPVHAAPVQNLANGHYYEAIELYGGITWRKADAAARELTYRGMPGHLATITSHEENDFLVRRFPRAILGHYWLGGFQLPGILDPAAGWQWVTGEPWSYTNWNNYGSHEPNDYYGPGTTASDENRLQFWTSRDGRWNDERNFVAEASRGYVVEYEPIAAVAPAITGYVDPDRASASVTHSAPGRMLRLTGANLGSGGTLLFGGSPLPAVIAEWTASEVLLWVPSAPSYPFTARVAVVVNGQRAEGPEFTIIVPIPEQDNLLANGSFEHPDSRGSSMPEGFTYGNPYLPDLEDYRGYSIPGWRIPWGTIDVVGRAWTDAPQQGRQSIDLVGSPFAAILAQTLFTEPGREYVLSGWMAHHYHIPEGRADLSLNGEFFQQLRHRRLSDSQDMGWQPFAFRFKATAAQTTLAFSDVTKINEWEGLTLDGLSLTLAPPEPSPAANSAGN